MQFDGKVTVVTGGGTGIGRATAMAFADEGSKVVIGGRRENPLRSTVATIQERGGEATYALCDVSKPSDVASLIDTAVDSYGGIDNLVNNAAIDVPKLLAKTTEEEWDLVLDINLKGQFLCAKEAFPRLLERGGGCIVNTASVLGIASMRGVGSYCASKAGIIALTRSMALEWTKLGIRVNCVAPGSTETAMMYGDLSDVHIPARRRAEEDVIPIGRLADPSEIAQVSTWLCGPGASFMAGATIVVDGGALAEYPAPRWAVGNPDAR